MSTLRIRFFRAKRTWGNGFIESFNVRLRDRVLDGKILYTLKEANRDRKLAPVLQRRSIMRLRVQDVILATRA